MERTVQKSVDKDTSHPNFNIPAKKKRKKATWCNGFVVAKPSTDMDKVENDRMDMVKDFYNRLIKAKF